MKTRAAWISEGTRKLADRRTVLCRLQTGDQWGNQIVTQCFKGSIQADLQQKLIWAGVDIKSLLAEDQTIESYKGRMADTVKVVPSYQSAPITTHDRGPRRSHIRVGKTLQEARPIGGDYPSVGTTGGGAGWTAQWGWEWGGGPEYPCRQSGRTLRNMSGA